MAAADTREAIEFSVGLRKDGEPEKDKSSLSHFEILKEASKKASNTLKTTVHLEWKKNGKTVCYSLRDRN